MRPALAPAPAQAHLPQGTPLWLLDDRFTEHDPAAIVDLVAR